MYITAETAWLLAPGCWKYWWCGAKQLYTCSGKIFYKEGITGKWLYGCNVGDVS